MEMILVPTDTLGMYRINKETLLVELNKFIGSNISGSESIKDVLLL